MADDKKTEGTPKGFTPEQRKLEQLTTELGYHENSSKRIDEVRGYLHRLEIKGSDAVGMAEALQWLKGVKQNVKYQAGKLREEIKTLSDTKTPTKLEAKNAN